MMWDFASRGHTGDGGVLFMQGRKCKASDNRGRDVNLGNLSKLEERRGRIRHNS